MSSVGSGWPSRGKGMGVGRYGEIWGGRRKEGGVVGGHCSHLDPQGYSTLFVLEREKNEAISCYVVYAMSCLFHHEKEGMFCRQISSYL